MTRLVINDQSFVEDPYSLMAAFDYLKPQGRVQSLISGDLKLNFDEISAKFFRDVLEWHRVTVKERSVWVPPSDVNAGGMLVAACSLLLQQPLWQDFCETVQHVIPTDVAPTKQLIDILEHTMYG